MMEVLLTTVREVQVVPPMETVAPVKNPLPVMVAVVAPANFPLLGLIEVMVGIAL